MAHSNLAFATPISIAPWKRWLVYSPLVRILLFIVLFAATSTIAATLAGHPEWAYSRIRDGQVEPGLDSLLLRAIPALIAYLILVRVVEKRWPVELSFRRGAPRLLFGLAVGALVVVPVIAVMWLLGTYRIEGLGGQVNWLNAFVFFALSAGLFEEIAFRGVLFRIVEEGLGTVTALLVSALAFGAAHLGNTHATPWSALAIAVEAGLLFGMVYQVTRSLWATIGMHAAWNMLEGPVFGTSVSGLPPKGWIKASLHGSDLVTGGPFGPEASVVTMIVASVITAVLMLHAWRRGLWVAPSWLRRDAPASRARHG